MTSMNLSNITFLRIKNVDYCCGLSKSEAINLMQNIDLIKKKWKTLWISKAILKLYIC